MAAGPKKHHYVPQAYLRAFADSRERLYSYRKDDPAKPHHLNVRNVAAENYYYAQPTPDGGRDVSLERAFGEVENHWPEIVRRLADGQQLSPHLIDLFYQFLGLMRVRGPATRDALELQLAEQVRALGRVMERNGDLPPKPAGLEEALSFENLSVSIDPHMSIHGMPSVLCAFGQILSVIGFSIVRNGTSVPFLTSDNPVLYFDPTVPEARMRPYAVENGPIVELLFPLSPNLMLVGRSEWANPISHQVLAHITWNDQSDVERANRLVVRFGYHAVFASNRMHDELIARWAAESPVTRTVSVPTPDGELTITQTCFGPRPKKPRWKTSGASRPERKL